MNSDGHPRMEEYRALNAYSISKGTGSLTHQLRAAPTREVSLEIWQVVADCFRIELLVISGGPRQQFKGRLPVVPRENHNSRQVFLRRETYNEYHFVRPDKPDPYQWRYSAHMPPDVLKPPADLAQRRKFVEEVEESDVRRCPYLQTDADGLPLQPYEDLAGYSGVWKAPEHLLDEADQRPHPTDEQLRAYINNRL